MAGYYVDGSLTKTPLPSGTSGTVVVPSGQLENDVVVVVAVGINLTTASFTWPAGWESVGTLAAATSGGSQRYQRVGASPLADFTLSWSLSRPVMVYSFIIRGLDVSSTTSCFGSLQTANQTSSGTATTPAMTITDAQQFIVLVEIGERDTENGFLDATECIELAYDINVSCSMGIGYTYAQSSQTPVFHAHGRSTGGQVSIAATCWVGDGTTTKVLPYPEDTCELVFKDNGAHVGITKTQFDPTDGAATPQITSITNVVSGVSQSVIYNTFVGNEVTHEISTTASITGLQANPTPDSPNLILNGMSFSSSVDLSDTLLAFQASIDPSITDTSDNLGRIIGFEDNSNNVAFYLFNSSDSPLLKGVNTFLIDTGATGGPNGATNAVTGYEIATFGSGAVDYSAITAIYQGWKPSNYSSNLYMGDMHTVGTFRMFGGDADDPISFTVLKNASKAGSLNTIKQLGDGLFLLLSDLEIGDGGTTDIYWDSSNQSIELPGAYDYDTGNIQFQMDSASRTVNINPGAGKTCKFPSTLINFKNYHNIVFTSGTVSNAATILNATPTFTGSSITSWVFSGCKGYSGTIGTTFNSCIFDSLATGETEYFSVSSEAEFDKLIGQTFRNASGAGQAAVEITGNQTGTWTTDPNLTVSGNTFDIRYTGATNFSIASANALTVTNTGAGVLTIVTPVNTHNINTDIVVDEIRRFTNDSQTRADFDTDVDTLAYTYSVTDPYDIEALKQGYVPVNRQNVIPINGDYDIIMDFDEAYNASHALTIVTHYTFDRGTLNFNILADQNAFDVRSSMADTIRTNGSYYNTPLLLEAKPGGKRIDLINGATITSMATWKGAGMERYDAADAINPVEKWYAVQSVNNISGAAVVYRQTNSGDFTVGSLTNNVFDEALQFYSDPDHDGTPATENNSYLLIKALRVGYRQARNDVVAGNGGASLKADLYTIGLAPTAHDYAGGPIDLSATMTLVTGGTVGGKTFAYKWVDAGTNSGTDIADWINYMGATAPNGLIPGGTGLRWAEMPDMVIYNGSEIWTANGYREGATPTLVGFYMERSGADHPDMVRAQADDGTYYTPAQAATVTISNITTTSRVQLYDTVNLVELYNGVPGSTSYQFSETYSIDRTVRVRITDVVGATAKLMIEATVGSISVGNYDIGYIASQQNDSVYNTNAIDGSTVTGITIDDTFDLVNINISGGSVTWAQIYAYEVYWLNTATGIQDDFAFIEAPDTANYILTSFQIKNTSSPMVPLEITGGYGRDSTTGASVDLVDTSGGTLIFAPDHVVPFSTGSGLTASQDAALLAVKGKTDQMSFTTDTQSQVGLNVNVEAVNGVNVTGDGVGTPMGAN